MAATLLKRLQRGEVHATFGFGSNSVRQLRGRIGDQTLLGYPGRVNGHAIAFAGPNHSWSHDDHGQAGGTATLIKLDGETAFGTVAFLTDEQLSVLDGYEGVPYVYTREFYKGDVLLGGEWHNLKFVAYVKVDSAEWYPPSEAYRCAVLRNVRGSFPSVSSLVIRDTSGQVREEWQHPGHCKLGLGAILFEVGVRLKEPWRRLPGNIGPVKRALQFGGLDTAYRRRN
eukprot:TRINITY_DN55303_c0_g1_i11.p2 TRINITY_DN55303_c0_g1~~TRINITY_DN55303_c0_g1_i11.p2  ORF type:complete len:227 (+),score=17.93 TRINITY_DN55303_c0_g1_i11:116-796(+)